MLGLGDYGSSDEEDVGAAAQNEVGVLIWFKPPTLKIRMTTNVSDIDECTGGADPCCDGSSTQRYDTTRYADIITY